MVHTDNFIQLFQPNVAMRYVPIAWLGTFSGSPSRKSLISKAFAADDIFGRDSVPHANPAKALFVGFDSKLSIPRLGLVQLVRIPHCHGRATESPHRTSITLNRSSYLSRGKSRVRVPSLPPISSAYSFGAWVLPATYSTPKLLLTHIDESDRLMLWLNGYK